MTQKMVSQQEVLKALGIDSFRQLSKEKVTAFISLIPNMDKDLAVECIKQFPTFVELATEAVNQLDKLCDTAIKTLGESQRESIDAFKLILNSLSELLKKENLSMEERQWIIEQMVDVAGKIAAKDSEFKTTIDNIVKYGLYFAGAALFVGASMLGIKAYGGKLPKLKN